VYRATGQGRKRHDALDDCGASTYFKVRDLSDEGYSLGDVIYGVGDDPNSQSNNNNNNVKKQQR
jgi:hypothetical protein